MVTNINLLTGYFGPVQVQIEINSSPFLDKTCLFLLD